MTTRFQAFISSKMQELAAERVCLAELLPTLGDDLVNIHAWVFEDDAPASNMTIREVYLNTLKNSALYIGLFWNAYGEWTIDEFERATEWGIDRHIYVKNVDADKRDPRLQAFLDAQSGVVSGITPKWFTTLDDLREQVKKSTLVWLQDHLHRRVGDSSAVVAEFSDDIPDLPAKLIGREEIADEARGLLEENARVLLQGFGGMGKTALAATIAAGWLDDNKGSVLWLKAGSENADALMEALARPFDSQKEVASATGNDKLRALRTLLTSSGIGLIVLDDVWDGTALSQVIKAVPRSIPVLVSARQRYAMDNILEVGKLSEAKSLELLGYFVRQDLKKDRDAQELCRQLGYHAFALEVAGKTLKVDRISPRELVNRIMNAPHAISMPEDFAEEGRSSITELLDASLYALDEKVRRVFVAFGSLFVPSATPELLSRAMGRDQGEIEEALTTLQRRGLAERSSSSNDEMAAYYVHDLAYSYARAIARSHPEYRAAMLRATLDFLTQHSDDLNGLDAERGNILGAAQAAHDQNDTMVLVTAMKHLIGTYLAARGHTLQFLALLDAAIEGAAELGEGQDETRHYLLSKRGNAYYDRADLNNALRCYQQALELARKLGKQDREVILLCVIGKVRADQKEDDAETYLEQAYQLAAALDEDFLRCFVLEYRGYYAQTQGDYEATQRFFAEEATLAMRTQDIEALFFALFNMGNAENKLGQLDDALSHHQQSLEVAEKENNRVWIARAQQAIGEDYHAMGHGDEARKYFDDALALFREAGIRANVAEIESILNLSNSEN